VNRNWWLSVRLGGCIEATLIEVVGFQFSVVSE
jgi:hypothetical protein